MAPKYRDILVRAFLYVAKDPDHHIRASSLSNLAEVCALLRYSLGNNIQQVNFLYNIRLLSRLCQTIT